MLNGRLPPNTTNGQQLSLATRIPVVALVIAGPAENSATAATRPDVVLSDRHQHTGLLISHADRTNTKLGALRESFYDGSTRDAVHMRNA